jgi:putative membrane protein
MLTRALLCVALAAADVPQVWDGLLPGSAESTVGAVDRAFAEVAAKTGRAEIRLAAMAELKATGAAVRALARHIARDHARAHDELRSIARNKQLWLDEEPTADQLATWLRLDQLDGSAFDEAYIGVMLDEHSRDVDAFEQYGLEGSDEELKAFAERTLPALRMHLTEAGESRVCKHPGS